MSAGVFECINKRVLTKHSNGFTRTRVLLFQTQMTTPSLVARWHADMHVYDVDCFLTFEADGSVEFYDAGFQGAYFQHLSGRYEEIAPPAAAPSSRQVRVVFDQLVANLFARSWTPLQAPITLLLDFDYAEGDFIVPQALRLPAEHYGARLRLTAKQVFIGGLASTDANAPPLPRDLCDFIDPAGSWQPKVFYAQHVPSLVNEQERARRRVAFDESCRARGIATLYVEAADTEEERRVQNERVLRLIKQRKSGNVGKDGKLK